MAPSQGRENVAVFNPIVLPLPDWHPDGPDGDVDGYVIPFVFPDERPSGRTPNRGAKIRVAPTPHGWRASLLNCQDHAETADQARAFAAAWIRTAEVLEAVTKRAGAAAAAEDKADEVFRAGWRVRVTTGDEAGRCGEVVESRLSEREPPQYDVLLEPDQARMRGFETMRFEQGDLEFCG